MFGKLILVATIVLCLISPSFSQDPIFDKNFQNYQKDLDSRDSQKHYGEVISLMANFDKQPIIEGFINQEFYTVYWDTNISNIVVQQNGKDIPVSLLIDDKGRPTFYNNLFSGWLDTEGDNIHFQAKINGSEYRWITAISLIGEEHVMFAMAAAKRCLCKGSNEECSGGVLDCQNPQPCTLPTGAGSKCQMLEAPIPTPQPTRFCGQGISLTLPLTIMGLLLIFRKK